jgi:hypothetical protein
MINVMTASAEFSFLRLLDKKLYGVHKIIDMDFPLAPLDMKSGSIDIAKALLTVKVKPKMSLEGWAMKVKKLTCCKIIENGFKIEKDY